MGDCDWAFERLPMSFTHRGSSPNVVKKMVLKNEFSMKTFEMKFHILPPPLPFKKPFKVERWY